MIGPATSGRTRWRIDLPLKGGGVLSETLHRVRETFFARVFRYVLAPAGDAAACGAFKSDFAASDDFAGSGFPDVSLLLALGGADIAGAVLPQTGSSSPSPQLRGR